MGDIETRRTRLLQTGLHLIAGFALVIVPALIWLWAMLPRAFHLDFETGSTDFSPSAILPTGDSLLETVRLCWAFAADLSTRHTPEGIAPRLLGTVSMVMWAALIILGMGAKGRRMPWPIVWISLALAPLVLVTALSTGHFLAPRYLFFLHAPLCLLATWGVEAILKRTGDRLPVALTFTVLIMGTSVTRLANHHQTEKANWRDAVTLLAQSVEPGDIVTAGPNADFACLGHYLKPLTNMEGWTYFNWFDMPQYSVGEVIDIANARSNPPARLLWEGVTTPHHLQGLMASGRRVWFITANWGFEHRSPDFWQFLGDQFTEVAVYEGLGDVRILSTN